jgi:hypothetical protein
LLDLEEQFNLDQEAGMSFAVKQAARLVILLCNSLVAAAAAGVPAQPCSAHDLNPALVMDHSGRIAT